MQVVFFRSKKSPEDRFCFPLSPSSPTLGWGTASHLRGIMWSSNFQIEGDDLYKCKMNMVFLSGNTWFPVPVRGPPSLSKLPRICWSPKTSPRLSQNVGRLWSNGCVWLPLPRRWLAGLHLAPWEDHKDDDDDKDDRLRRKLLHLMSFWFQVCNVIPPLLLMVTQQQRCRCGWQQWCHTHDDDSAVAGETNC